MLGPGIKDCLEICLEVTGDLIKSASCTLFMWAVEYQPLISYQFYNHFAFIVTAVHCLYLVCLGAVYVELIDRIVN
jgi:hypothetical protein